MTEDKGILIRNVYYMLAYAFQELKQSHFEDIAKEDFERIQDLFAEILYRGVSAQLKHGLYKEYIEKLDTTRFVKSHYASRYHIPGVTYYKMLFPKNPIGFSRDIASVVYSGQTVTYSMIQFAAYMGFKEIYLIGVDCNYSKDNSTISADSYFDKRLFPLAL